MFEEGEYSIIFVRARIKDLIERGDITEEEIQKCKKEANQAKKELQEISLSIKKQEEKQRNELQQSIRKENKNRKEEEFRNLLLQGLSVEEIGERIGCLKETVYVYITRLKKQGKISDEEIKKAKNQRSEEQKKVKNYKRSLDIAVKIVHEPEMYTSKQINHHIQKIIDIACQMQKKGLLRTEEIQIISAALFQADEVDLNNVLGIARLYLRKKEYQESIDTLSYSKQFLMKDDEFKRVNEALQMVEAYKQKMEKTKKVKYSAPGTQQNSLEAQGDDEFPDL